MTQNILLRGLNTSTQYNLQVRPVGVSGDWGPKFSFTTEGVTDPLGIYKPRPVKNSWVVSSTTGGECLLTVLPLTSELGSSINLSLNGMELEEGVDYTANYTTGQIIVSQSLNVGDVITADYWTIGALPTPPAPNTVTFNYTGTVQTWTVPTGVTSIVADLYGSQGGVGFGHPASAGGKGGHLQVAVTVTPGEILQVLVPNQPGFSGSARPGGYNGGGAGGDWSADGGGGGGAADIRRTPYALANRLAVAGGGGGSGCWSPGGTSGTGFGGAGGGSVGANGTLAGVTDATCGHGGSQSAGGANATAPVIPATVAGLGQGADAANGSLGTGGAGGGGGFYGGGAATSNNSAQSGGGGGGGSSGVATGVTILNNTQGAQSGNGLIVIKFYE